MLANQFCSFQQQDQTTGTKWHSTSTWKSDTVNARHVPIQGYHTHGDVQLPTWPTFSVIIHVGAIVLHHFENSKGPSRFTVQKPMVWWLWKFGAHQSKGSINMQHIIIATIIAILYSPIHSFLPVLPISKDQNSQRKSCASWFGDGSSEATEEDF